MNITIVGGGFGGVKAARELLKDPRNHVTLITDKPDFQYYPSLYSVATGHAHVQAWLPLGVIFAGQKKIEVIIDTITAIDKPKQKLTGASGAVYEYQTLILALGNVTTYFGIEGLDKFAYGIKSYDEIRDLKDHIHQEFTQKDKRDKRYVIIGAGPTGVELAASFGDYLNEVYDHYGVTPNYQIDVVEAVPRVLPKMSERVSKKVNRRLQKLGINVMTGKAVQRQQADTLMVAGEPIHTTTVIWTSGVANNPFYQQNAAAFEFSPNHRIVVNKHLKSSEHIYVIGDNAFTPYAGLAQVAVSDAIFVAKNIRRHQDHLPLKDYKPSMPAVVIPVGEGWAVFAWKKLVFTGWVASLIRRAADIIGYRDIAPWREAFSAWRAQAEPEDDYFTS